MDISDTRIVVVDDDAEIRDLLREYLADEGFAVQVAQDGAALRAIVSDWIPDIVLLDLRLPGEDGLTLASELRQQLPSTGILMISGKDDVVDRVAGLEVGADDYITKPFHLREVLARVRSVLRRRETEAGEGPGAEDSGMSAHVDNSTEPTVYRFYGWTLDCDRRELLGKGGTPIDLTSGEFNLLLAFATRPKRALSRDQLLDYVSNREAESFDRSIDVQVGRLRRKIEQNPKRPALIKTVRNVGYMLDADVTTSRGSG